MSTMTFLIILYVLLEGASLGIAFGLDIKQVGIFDPRRKKWATVSLVLMLAGFALIPFMASTRDVEEAAEEAP